jgi:hypothetical protein
MSTENKKDLVICSDLPVAYQLELHRAIEIDAYLRAEADGFRQSALDYWLAAEKDVKC